MHTIKLMKNMQSELGEWSVIEMTGTPYCAPLRTSSENNVLLHGAGFCLVQLPTRYLVDSRNNLFLVPGPGAKLVCIPLGS